MAYFSDEDLFEEMMDPCQFMFWDKEDRPYHLMGSYDDYDSDSDGIPGVLLAQMLQLNKTKPRSRLCKFFQRGSCRYGNQCRFEHRYEKPVDESCIFFQRGYCRYGQDCKFKHAGMEKPIITETKDLPANEVQNNTQSPFFPTDEDLKAGRLTRLKYCLDIPIKGSISVLKPLHHGSHYIELFVNKREDDVHYLYDAIIERAKHPLYQKGMFDLCKPGTSCDLSDCSAKLKDTTLLIFGNCIELLFRQSFKLASILNNADKDGDVIKADERRYPASELPRNADGSFVEPNLKSLIKTRDTPNEDELFPKDSIAIKLKEGEFESCDEQAQHFRLSEKYSKYLTVHDKVTCQWCTEQGCQCLDESAEVFDSDDSEFSTDSRGSSDFAKSNAQRRVTKRYNCGVFPEEICVGKIYNLLQKNNITGLKFGDLITFGESRIAGTYVLGKHGKLFKAAGPDFLTIPFQITMYLKDAMKKYQKLLQQNPGKTNDVIEMYLRHDDEMVKKAFDRALPSAWKYCMVARYGAGITELTSDAVQRFRVEFKENTSIDVVAPGSKTSKENPSYPSSIEEIMQKYQSAKENANHVSFEIELSLNDQDKQNLIGKHGMLEPQIPTWFITSQNCPNTKDCCLKFSGPKHEVEIVKAIVEDFYEGCIWRYARIKW